MFYYVIRIRNIIDGNLYQHEVNAQNRAEAVQAAMREVGKKIKQPRHLIAEKVFCDLRESCD